MMITNKQIALASGVETMRRLGDMRLEGKIDRMGHLGRLHRVFEALEAKGISRNDVMEYDAETTEAEHRLYLAAAEAKREAAASR